MKPRTKDIEVLVHRIAVRSERWLEKMGFGFGSEDAVDEDLGDAGLRGRAPPMGTG